MLRNARVKLNELRCHCPDMKKKKCLRLCCILEKIEIRIKMYSYHLTSKDCQLRHTNVTELIFFYIYCVRTVRSQYAPWWRLTGRGKFYFTYHSIWYSWDYFRSTQEYYLRQLQTPIAGDIEEKKKKTTTTKENKRRDYRTVQKSYQRTPECRRMEQWAIFNNKNRKSFCYGYFKLKSMSNKTTFETSISDPDITCT